MELNQASAARERPLRAHGNGRFHWKGTSRPWPKGDLYRSHGHDNGSREALGEGALVEFRRALAPTDGGCHAKPRGERLHRVNSDAFATRCPTHRGTHGQGTLVIVGPWGTIRCILLVHPFRIFKVKSYVHFLQDPLGPNAAVFRPTLFRGPFSWIDGCGVGRWLGGWLGGAPVQFLSTLASTFFWHVTQMWEITETALCALAKRCFVSSHGGTDNRCQ